MFRWPCGVPARVVNTNSCGPLAVAASFASRSFATSPGVISMQRRERRVFSATRRPPLASWCVNVAVALLRPISPHPIPSAVTQQHFREPVPPAHQVHAIARARERDPGPPRTSATGPRPV
jgi:hypothetical protein